MYMSLVVVDETKRNVVHSRRCYRIIALFASWLRKDLLGLDAAAFVAVVVFVVADEINNFHYLLPES